MAENDELHALQDGCSAAAAEVDPADIAIHSPTTDIMVSDPSCPPTVEYDHECLGVQPVEPKPSSSGGGPVPLGYAPLHYGPAVTPITLPVRDVLGHSRTRSHRPVPIGPPPSKAPPNSTPCRQLFPSGAPPPPPPSGGDGGDAVQASPADSDMQRALDIEVIYRPEIRALHDELAALRNMIGEQNDAMTAASHRHDLVVVSARDHEHRMQLANRQLVSEANLRDEFLSSRLEVRSEELEQELHAIAQYRAQVASAVAQSTADQRDMGSEMSRLRSDLSATRAAVSARDATIETLRISALAATNRTSRAASMRSCGSGKTIEGLQHALAEAQHQKELSDQHLHTEVAVMNDRLLHAERSVESRSLCERRELSEAGSVLREEGSAVTNMREELESAQRAVEYSRWESRLLRSELADANSRPAPTVSTMAPAASVMASSAPAAGTSVFRIGGRSQSPQLRTDIEGQYAMFDFVNPGVSHQGHQSGTQDLLPTKLYAPTMMMPVQTATCSAGHQPLGSHYSLPFAGGASPAEQPSQGPVPPPSGGGPGGGGGDGGSGDKGDGTGDPTPPPGLPVDQTENSRRKKPDGGGGGGSGSSDSGSNNGSSGHSSGSSRHRKRKESPLTLPAFPKNASSLPSWREQVRNRVVAASARGTKAFRWICAVEDEAISFESLGKSGRHFASMDDKLRSALSDEPKSDLAKEILRASELQRQQFRKPLKGRQVLRIVYEYYQTNKNLTQAYGLRDLMHIQLQSEDKLKGFLNSWMEMMANLKNPAQIDRDTVEELFYEQIKKCSQLREDVAHYRRCPLGHQDRSYEFLLERARSWLKEERDRNNRGAVVKALASAGGSAPAAPGPSAPGGSKGPGKGKGKDDKGKGKGGKDKGKGKGDKGKSKGDSVSSPYGSKTDTPCFKFAKNECQDPACPRKHKQYSQLTADEKRRVDDWFTKRAARASSPAPENKQKKKICTEWKKSGKCSLGDACKFDHPKKKGGGKGS